jgi:hypothetical protein
MTGVWTVKDELCRLAGVGTLPEALVRVGIASECAKSVTVRQATEWRRSGAETFSTELEVIQEGRVLQTLLLKACTPALAVGVPLDSILNAWLQRRNLLQSCHVATPHLYAFGNGVLLEEKIPYLLRDAIAATLPSSPQRLALISDLARFACTLSALGFVSQNAFSDLMSRGVDVVVVDFGADLGPPNADSPAAIDYLLSLTQWLSSQHIHLTKLEYRAIHSTYLLTARLRSHPSH